MRTALRVCEVFNSHPVTNFVPFSCSHISAIPLSLSKGTPHGEQIVRGARNRRHGSLVTLDSEAWQWCRAIARRQYRDVLAVRARPPLPFLGAHTHLSHSCRSDGPQPHLINIQFHKKMRVHEIVIYTDFKLGA